MEGEDGAMEEEGGATEAEEAEEWRLMTVLWTTGLHCWPLMAVSSSGLEMEEENDRLDLGEKKKRFLEIVYNYDLMRAYTLLIHDVAEDVPLFRWK